MDTTIMVTLGKRKGMDINPLDKINSVYTLGGYTKFVNTRINSIRKIFRRKNR